MNDFKIQPYTKKELALFYFPTANPHVAVNRLMSWVNRCKPLHKALLDQGYQKTSKWLSPREVKLITDHLVNRSSRAAIKIQNSYGNVRYRMIGIYECSTFAM